MPNYTLSDNQDGTGLTLTVTAGDPADTHRVYTAPFSGAVAVANPWTSAGFQTGDGAMAISIDAGHYFVYVDLNSGASISPPIYMPATDQVNPLHEQLLTAIQARIQVLALDSIASANIVIRKLPSDRGSDGHGDIPLPAIVLSPLGVEITPGGTNVRDDIDYPILISILAGDDQDLVNNRALYLGWRQAIHRSLRHHKLAVSGTGTAHYNTLIKPGPVVSPRDFWRNVWHSSMLVRSVCREPRGLAAAAQAIGVKSVDVDFVVT